MSTMGVSAPGRAWVRWLLPHARELALIAGAYWVYMYTRSLAFNDFGATALANAATIISFEKSLGFFWEPEWQSWAISSAKHLVIFFNWAYIITFWPILLSTGVILYLANRQRYRYYRNVVLITFIFALLGFVLFPLAPPRMIVDQFVDTIKAFGPAFYASREFANFYNPYAAMPSLHFSWTVLFGVLFPLAPPRMMVDHFVDTIKAFGPAFYASREFANFYNPYAAMPSLHFSWTLLFGVLFLRTPNKWIKGLGVLYPTLTLLAITITANHYLMDAVGGALLVIAAFLTIEIGFRRRMFLPTILSYFRSESWKRRVPSLHHNGMQRQEAGVSHSKIDPLAADSGLGYVRMREVDVTRETGTPLR